MDPFIGELRMFGFNFAPVGWALCQGQLLPIAQNAALFSILGTQYGGNGQTNFALPNLQGMVPIGHANDGGGSIRIPASECGLVGLKPTRGRVSLAPEWGDVFGGLVCELAVTRTVRDTAAVLDAVAGTVPGDPYVAPAPKRTYAQEVGADPGRLHIGLHHGTVLREGDATYGAAVNVAARICALSSADEVLVTEELRRLVSGSDGDGVAFVDRGIYVLKGVATPRRVFGALQAT